MQKALELLQLLPEKFRVRSEQLLETFLTLGEVRSVSALGSMLPSVGRGLVLRLGRKQEATEMLSGHTAHFDWSYASDFPEMRELYSRAKQNQWDSETTLDWSVDVDPLNPEVPLLHKDFLAIGEIPVTLDAGEELRLQHSVASWMLSQFLHGEQGALYAAAQVTESVRWMDGKLYGATQVMDEGRHVETFHRYLETKLNKIYTVNDNLFVIIDALISDSRWDLKFLGMQIMVEGLALGAFGALYRMTEEPLLKDLLRYIIQDEARHVHYGVLALREHFTKELSDKERREREDWAFEVALLMRNRFLAHEVYEEWFQGMMSRFAWNKLVTQSKGMREFREVMFRRLIPNLREIGLLSPRIQGYYEQAGLMAFADGADATHLSAETIMHDLDSTPRLVAAS